MDVRDKHRLRWVLGPWLVVWIWIFFQMGSPLFKAVWACLVIFNVGAYWLASRSNIDTERGLQRVSSLLIGLIYVQIAVAIFIAVEAAGKK